MALTITDPNIAKLDSLIKKAVPQGPKGIPFLKNMLREITLKRPQDVGSKKYLLLAGELQARKSTAEKMKGAGPKPPSVMQSLTAPAPQEGLGLDMSQPAVRNLAAQNQMATIGGKPPAGKGGGIVAFQSTGFVNLQEILKDLDKDERARVETLLRSGRNPFPEKIKGKLIPGYSARSPQRYEQVANPAYALTQRFIDENPTGMAPGIGFNRAKDTEIKQNYLANLEQAMAGVDPSQAPVAPPQINSVIASNNNNISPSFRRPVDGVDEAVKIIKAQTDAGVAPPLPSGERRNDGITVENISASTDLSPDIPISDSLDPAAAYAKNRAMFASDFPVQGKGLMAQLSPQDQAILAEPDVNVLYEEQIKKDKALYGDETKNRVDLINESMKGLKGLKKELGYKSLLVAAGTLGTTPGSILDGLSAATKAATPTIINGLEKIKDNTDKLKFKEAELKDLLVKRGNAITKSARDSIDKKVDKAQANRTNLINTNSKELTKISATMTNAQLTTRQQQIANELRANELNITRAKYKNESEFKAVKAQAEMINDVFNSIIQAKAKEGLGAALDEDDFETYMKQAKRLVFNRTVTPPQ